MAPFPWNLVETCSKVGREYIIVWSKASALLPLPKGQVSSRRPSGLGGQSLSHEPRSVLTSDTEQASPLSGPQFPLGGGWTRRSLRVCPQSHEFHYPTRFFINLGQTRSLSPVSTLSRVGVYYTAHALSLSGS